jgi:hypothetical protein
VELRTIPAHDSIFHHCYPDHEIVGQQGCGDLTMNAWNVAYVNDALAVNPSSGEKPPVLICLPQEQVEYRTYSCLVKWKPSEAGTRRLTIEECRFRRPRQAIETNEMVSVRFGDEWLPRGDSIEFAVSNQQVIRDGQLAPIVTSCHQFGDLRHLLQMPNLNPAGALFPGEPAGGGGHFRPREYFGKEQFGDIWCGEEAFIDDRTQNLLRAALTGPIFLDFPAGSNEKRLRGALSLSGYRETERALEPLTPGAWRFVKRSSQETVVEVFFKRNTYAWSMIGLSPDNRRILCLACNGRPGVTGYTVEQAAEILRSAGAWNALLIDEGADVFQRVRDAGGRLTDMVDRLRRRLRGTFIFATRRESPSGNKEPE